MITQSETTPRADRRARMAGYAFALCAGIIWGTTGPLSTLLYAEGAALTAVGFWRILLAVAGFVIYGLLFARDLFKTDRQGLLIVGVVGGLLVALFEVGFQFAIAGVGIAPAVVILYTAPIIVTIAARLFLGEALTPMRMALAVIVLVGVALTVNGTVTADGDGATRSATRTAGIIGGALSASATPAPRSWPASRSPGTAPSKSCFSSCSAARLSWP